MKPRNAVMPLVAFDGYPLPALLGDGFNRMFKAADFVVGKMGIGMPSGMCVDVYEFMRSRAVNKAAASLYARLEPWGA